MLQIYPGSLFTLILPKKPTKYKSSKKLMYRNPLYPGLYQTQRLVPHAIRVSIWCRAACRIRVPNLTSWGIHQVGPQAVIPLDSLTVRQYGICTRSCSIRLNFQFSIFYFLLWIMEWDALLQMDALMKLCSWMSPLFTLLESQWIYWVCTCVWCKAPLDHSDTPR
jgi:hypothetical protein